MVTVGNPITHEYDFHIRQGGRGKRELQVGAAPMREISLGRVPRITRLMALAIRFEKLLSAGEVRDYAELARLGHVTRARITQVMNLLNLAPDIQEELLFLSPVQAGHDPIKEWQVRPIAATPAWRKQRKLWIKIKLRHDG
jgi:hypothetical protein